MRVDHTIDRLFAFAPAYGFTKPASELDINREAERHHLAFGFPLPYFYRKLWRKTDGCIHDALLFRSTKKAVGGPRWQLPLVASMLDVRTDCYGLQGHALVYLTREDFCWIVREATMECQMICADGGRELKTYGIINTADPTSLEILDQMIEHAVLFTLDCLDL